MNSPFDAYLGGQRKVPLYATADAGASSRAAAEAKAASGGAGPQLLGAWAAFMRKAVSSCTAQDRPTPMTRLTHASGLLPGF